MHYDYYEQVINSQVIKNSILIFPHITDHEKNMNEPVKCHFNMDHFSHETFQPCIIVDDKQGTAQLDSGRVPSLAMTANDFGPSLASCANDSVPAPTQNMLRHCHAK